MLNYNTLKGKSNRSFNQVNHTWGFSRYFNDLVNELNRCLKQKRQIELTDYLNR